MLNAGSLRHGRDESVEVVALGLGDDLDAVGFGFAGRLRADRDTGNLETEGGERPRRRRGGEYHKVAFGRVGRAQLPRSVEDDGVGAERFGEVRPSVLGPCEEDAAGWVRQLGDKALLGGHPWHECRLDAVLVECGRRAGPDRGDPRELAATALRELASPARTG